jgi:hypothetical protein
MFKPLTRVNKTSLRSNGGFAETMLLHTAEDDDYSGFAPTEMSGMPEADDPAPAVPQSWATSQWVAAQEAKAHEAADQARAVIAAQRRADEQVEAAHGYVAPQAAPRTGLARLRAAFGRLLPGEFRSLLPLFIGVSVTMALMSSVLPLVDRL